MIRIISSIILLLTLHACKIPDPIIPNEDEVITTLTYKLTPLTGGSEINLQFNDPDGIGGAPPVISGGNLAPNTTYKGVMELINEQLHPPYNITSEIEKEALDHQFFFENENGLLLNIMYDDTDANGHPVGLNTILKTTTASTGTLKITLRHQPDKSAAEVKGGNISNAGGETDIEVEFPIHVN